MSNEADISFIGIDIGGTFTDAVFFSNGSLSVMKTPTTIDDPSRGVLLLTEKLSGVPFILNHGSTLATNAVLERKGAKTAFIATSGFSHILSIGRQIRPELYKLEISGKEPLVDEEICYNLPERVDYMGDILKHPHMETLREILKDAMEKGAEAIAICFLFSYKNPSNEEKVAEKARELFSFVSASSSVLPEYREYERASTTALNAYVGPILHRYVSRLEEALNKAGAVDFRIMESGGGILPANLAGQLGVRTILSGPAGGVAGAYHLAKMAGYDRIITLDMGGTSTDVSLLDGGINLTTEGSIDGFPIRVPMVDIETIGAGGGSIAYIDEGGLLKVGPESAGADPGPACYGKSYLPTVTDAHMVMGAIAGDDLLGGQFKVDPERSFEAVGALAAKGNMTVMEAASGIVRIAISHMQRALRIVSVERGYDPSRFVLAPFGGAGPLHAPFLAEEMSIDKILILPHPGVLSAVGMLLSDFRRDFSKTVLMDLSQLTEDIFNGIVEDLHRKAVSFIKNGGFDEAAVEYFLEMRYKGQSYELQHSLGIFKCPDVYGTLELPPAPAVDPLSAEKAFGRLHRERYGYERESEPVELVNVRIDIRGKNKGPVFEPKELSTSEPMDEPTEVRKITLPDGTEVEAKKYRREDLRPGNVIMPPAVICQYDTVALVPPLWRATVDPFNNIIMERLP